MDLQEYRELCKVPGAVVSHEAMCLYFDAVVLREMVGDIGAEGVHVVPSFYRTVSGVGSSDWMVTWDRGPVAVGRYRVIGGYDPFWGQGASYCGPILTDPTWEDLVIEAEKQIRRTGDLHHTFLETADVDGSDIERLACSQGQGVLAIRLGMGS